MNERSFIFAFVRSKDQNKYRAICQAAIGAINALGFEGTSISKIARAAGVSPGTIYIYFENKEDLLNKLYLETKREMSLLILNELNSELSIEEAFSLIWKSYLQYLRKHPDKFQFIEQFANSPCINNVSRQEGKRLYAPVVELFERGKKEGRIKDISTEILIAYAFYPLLQLTKQHLLGELNLNKRIRDEAFAMAWESISTHN